MQLLDLLKFGFALSVQPFQCLNRGEVLNHPSAVQHPKDVSHYIDKEIKAGAIFGPLLLLPLKST